MFYRDEIYSLQNLLSRTQAGPGRSVKKEQEEISPNHVQRINLISVLISHTENETRRIATQVFTLLITSQVLINKECSARRVGTHFGIMTYFLIIIWRGIHELRSELVAEDSTHVHAVAVI